MCVYVCLCVLSAELISSPEDLLLTNLRFHLYVIMPCERDCQSVVLGSSMSVDKVGSSCIVF